MGFNGVDFQTKPHCIAAKMHTQITPALIQLGFFTTPAAQGDFIKAVLCAELRVMMLLGPGPWNESPERAMPQTRPAARASLVPAGCFLSGYPPRRPRDLGSSQATGGDLN